MHWSIWIAVVALYACGAAATLRIISIGRVSLVTFCGLFLPLFASWFLMTTGNLMIIDSSRPRDGALLVLFGALVLPLLTSFVAVTRGNFRALVAGLFGWVGLPILFWTFILSEPSTSLHRLTECAVSNACDCPAKQLCNVTQANNAMEQIYAVAIFRYFVIKCLA